MSPRVFHLFLFLLPLKQVPLGGLLCPLPSPVPPKWALQGRRALTGSLCVWLPTILLSVRRTCASSWLLPWQPGSWHRWSGPQWERPPQMSPLATGSSAGGQSHHVCGVGEHLPVYKRVEDREGRAVRLSTASKTLQPACKLSFQPKGIITLECEDFDCRHLTFCFKAISKSCELLNQEIGANLHITSYIICKLQNVKGIASFCFFLHTKLLPFCLFPFNLTSQPAWMRLNVTGGRAFFNKPKLGLGI